MAFWACILLAGASENICLRGALQMNIFFDWLIDHRSRHHSAPVSKILSKSDHPRQKKCRKRWRISAIFDFRGPIMGSLQSPGTTSYRSSIETIAVKCLFFEKIAFFHFGDRQTNEQIDSIDPLSRSRCRQRRLNNLDKSACIQKM